MSASGGRCARTTARRGTPGPTSVTSSPAPSPTAGVRTAWRHLRRPADALLRARALERARSDPQGTSVRPHQPGGEPRRGRQGVLLLPRQHADTFLHAVPLQVPPAGIPLPRAGRDQRRSLAPRLRVRAHRHRHLPRRPVLRPLRRVRQGGAGRSADRNLGSQPRAARPRRCTCSRPSGFETAGGRTEIERPQIRVSRGEPSVLSATSAALGEYLLHCEPGASFLFADNETNPQRWQGQADPHDGQGPRYFKDGINDYVVDGAKEAINPRQVGTKAAAHYTFEIPAQGSSNASVAPLQREHRTRRRRPGEAILPGARDAQARGGRVLCRGHPGFALRRSSRGRSPVPGGHALEQAVLRLRRRRLADGARHRAVSGDERRRPPQRRLGAHGERRRHLDAGQVGVSLVRGLGSGVPRRAARSGRSGLRQEADLAAVERALPAPERSGPRLRMELRRRQSAGSRLERLLPLSAGQAAAQGTAISSS